MKTTKVFIDFLYISNVKKGEPMICFRNMFDSMAGQGIVVNYIGQYKTKGRNGEVVHNIMGETIDEVMEKRDSKKRKYPMDIFDVTNGRDLIFVKHIG